MMGTLAATKPAAAKAHPRLGPFAVARRSLRSESPRCTSGCQSLSARRGENRSAIMRSTSLSSFVFISLLSIAVNEFFSECFQCAAEERADGSRVQIQRRRQFLITEILAAEQQQFGLARFDDAQNQTDSVFLLLSRVYFVGRGTGRLSAGQ